MTEPLFLAELDDPQVGDIVKVIGDEGRHAVTVRRIHVDEQVLVSNGSGLAVRGPVTVADKNGMCVRVADVLHQPVAPVRFVVVQALAKGDRSELAVEMLTEIGVDEIVPWKASRSVARWAPEHVDRALGKWRSTARESTKQARRFTVPVVSLPMTTRELCARIPQTTATYVLHEGATGHLAVSEFPGSGDILVIVGPEGGIAPDELEAFAEAGAHVVSIADSVLRTSTAGVVALAQIQAVRIIRGL